MKTAFISNNKFGHCGCHSNIGDDSGASALDSDIMGGSEYSDANSDYTDNSADFIADPSIGYEVNADYSDTSADFGVSQNTSDNPNAALVDTSTGATPEINLTSQALATDPSLETVPTGNAAPTSMESGSSLDAAPASHAPQTQLVIQTKGIEPKHVVIGAAILAAILWLK